MAHPKKILFLDRDGTLIKEAPPTYQIDTWSKLEFYPYVFQYLSKIVAELNYECIIISNQDGLGTESFPEEYFWPLQQFIETCFANEGIHFSACYFDRTFASENAPTRKPNIGLLKHYLNNANYDIPNSFVIGDRLTDVQLAKNLGCKAIWLNNNTMLGADELSTQEKKQLKPVIALETKEWKNIYEFLKLPQRHIIHQRTTKETNIYIDLNIDGTGIAQIETGIGFFNHMLEQLAHHGGMNITLQVQGDLHIDEHHTIEDTAIVLGEAFALALQNKIGMERYGFVLPMDDAEAKVLIDFGGRSWLIWNATFIREKIGDMPTEMFLHFFKSFSDAAKCNLHIECSGENEHHKIEAIFKAFARAIRMAVKRNTNAYYLPSTKGVL